MGNYVANNEHFEHARIIFKNFAGEKGDFNRAGDRSFCVVIDDIDQANRMIEDGWNVKIKQPRDEGDRPSYHLEVKVSFDPYPPQIYLVAGESEPKEITEDTVHTLDFAEIKYVDLTIKPYNWEVNGKSGVKAYCKTMYVVIEQDRFAHKYKNFNDEPMPF